MTNEELQTLISNACKAAGWRIKRMVPDSHGATTIWIDDAPVIVRLAADDGDSRMLQVACRIGLDFVKDVEELARATSQYDEYGVYMCAEEPLQDDANKSARMAVLRCAAMIGEAME